MALILKDRVKETTTVTGTGTATLLGAAAGFQSFSTIGNGNTTYYCITGGGSEWEVGIGTYTASGTTLARTTVLASSNGGSLVVFTAGIKDVFVVLGAWQGDVPGAHIIINDQWEEGMGSSLRAGLRTLLENPKYLDVVISLVDLPGMTAAAIAAVTIKVSVSAPPATVSANVRLPANTNVSLPAPPANVSFPTPPSKVSAPAPPTRLLAPPLPTPTKSPVPA